MDEKAKPRATAVSNGAPLTPTPELLRLIRERFPEEGKEERIALALAAVRRFTSTPTRLTLEELRQIAEDPDLLEQ